MGLVIRSLWLEELNLSKFSKEHKPNWTFEQLSICVSARREGLNTECVLNFAAFLCHSAVTYLAF